LGKWRYQLPFNIGKTPSSRYISIVAGIISCVKAARNRKQNLVVQWHPPEIPRRSMKMTSILIYSGMTPMHLSGQH
jgi:hypothetical protein